MRAGIKNILSVVRTSPVLVLRGIAILGALLWAFAALWITTVVSAGFVRWDSPNVYVSLLFVISGIAVNVVLLTRATALSRGILYSLLTISLLSSAIVIGLVAYMAELI